MDTTTLAHLQRHRGYHDARIRPYPSDTTRWIAEVYISGRTAKKTWKVLREERSERYRLFTTAEAAALAVEDWVNRFDR